MSKSKSFVKRKRQSGDMALQITSMADIFMILLVFLLKSYSSSITTVTPTAQISLPEVGKGTSQIKDSLKVEVAAEAVLVDQKTVARLRNFEFEADQATDPAISPAVFGVLNSERTRMPEPNRDTALIVMADQKAPYATIKRVVASAAKAGFVDLQLVVVNPE